MLRRLLRCSVLLLTATAGTVLASEPDCDTLVRALPAVLERALEVEVAVSLQQGGREVAYERSRITRAPDGVTDTTVLERRGLRRPPAGTGTFTLPCESYDLSLIGDEARLVLVDPDPDAPVRQWTLRFDRAGSDWHPLELVASFEFRVLLVPVRGRFVTTFAGWVFPPD